MPTPGFVSSCDGGVGEAGATNAGAGGSGFGVSPAGRGMTTVRSSGADGGLAAACAPEWGALAGKVGWIVNGSISSVSGRYRSPDIGSRLVSPAGSSMGSGGTYGAGVGGGGEGPALGGRRLGRRLELHRLDDGVPGRLELEHFPIVELVLDRRPHQRRRGVVFGWDRGVVCVRPRIVGGRRGPGGGGLGVHRPVTRVGVGRRSLSHHSPSFHSATVPLPSQGVRRPADGSGAPVARLIPASTFAIRPSNSAEGAAGQTSVPRNAKKRPAQAYAGSGRVVVAVAPRRRHRGPPRSPRCCSDDARRLVGQLGRRR